MKIMRKMIIALSLLLSTGITIAQKNKEVKPNAPINWYLKDPKKDKVYGVGAEKAYELLKGKTAKEIIVAVIDSGVETDHPDLKDVIWVNKGEIPNNGIDDDKNGYIDDVHGWSFLGGAGGDIKSEALELARMVRSEKSYFAGKTASDVPASDKERYDKYVKLKAELDQENAKNQQQYQGVMMMAGYINNVKAASNGVFDKKTNKAYVPKDEMETKIKKRIGPIMLIYPPATLDKEINNATETFGNLIKMNNMDVDSVRRVLVGDNPQDMTERYYGCNRYEGPDAFHGTHVAGIIAATRGNGIGIEGIASNVKIMAVRAVPNGDERDKDVANAIRYAVDNGAKVINMSFGKYYTPNKQVVDEAILYAKSKDVLLVHAAGNDAKNKDIEDSYPTRILSDGSVASNWIEVGASSSSKKGKKLIADFSNYGSKTVDVFAPGVDIYSTVPDAKYDDASGTSMACPATAGVAAMIRGYFPELTAAEVKEVLMKTSVPYTKTISIPGAEKGKENGTMKDISISGGMVNAARAVEYLIKK
jgi:subtilisin family serine protease